jgi:hypothetical protein
MLKLGYSRLRAAQTLPFLSRTSGEHVFDLFMAGPHAAPAVPPALSGAPIPPPSRHRRGGRPKWARRSVFSFLPLVYEGISSAPPLEAIR